jgi:hypothetical protein
MMQGSVTLTYHVSKRVQGGEIWRRQYISRHDHDDGTDVVQNPAIIALWSLDMLKTYAQVVAQLCG